MRYRNDRDDRIIKDFKIINYYNGVQAFKEKHENNKDKWKIEINNSIKILDIGTQNISNKIWIGWN